MDKNTIKLSSVAKQRIQQSSVAKQRIQQSSVAKQRIQQSSVAKQRIQQSGNPQWSKLKELTEGTTVLSQKTTKDKLAKLTSNLKAPTIGDTVKLNVTTVSAFNGSNKIGIGYLPAYIGFSILVPHATLGESIEAKILSVNNKAKYAIAHKLSTTKDKSAKLTSRPLKWSVTKVIKDKPAKLTSTPTKEQELSSKQTSLKKAYIPGGIHIGTHLTVNTKKVLILKGGTGLIEIAKQHPAKVQKSYFIIIPNYKLFVSKQTVAKVLITKVKQQYAVGNIITEPVTVTNKKLVNPQMLHCKTITPFDQGLLTHSVLGSQPCDQGLLTHSVLGSQPCDQGLLTHSVLESQPCGLIFSKSKDSLLITSNTPTAPIQHIQTAQHKKISLKKGSKLTIQLPKTIKQSLLNKQTTKLTGGAMLHFNNNLTSFILKATKLGISTSKDKSAELTFKDKSAELTFKDKSAELTSLSVNTSKDYKAKNQYLFIPYVWSLNAKPGDLVRIKVTNVLTLRKGVIAIAKILQVNPLLKAKQHLLIKQDLRQMISSGVHLGDNTSKHKSTKLTSSFIKGSSSKWNVQMKKYLWSNKRVTKSNSKLGSFRSKDKSVELTSNKQSYLNVLKTRRCLNKVLSIVGKYAAMQTTFLFVGTKKPAAALVAKASLLTRNSFFVNTKWLGGMLTNWKTIVKSIAKINPILKEKQAILKEIQQQRQSIKTRLIKKALLLRNKRKHILQKRRSLCEVSFADLSLDILKNNLKVSNSYTKDFNNINQTELSLQQLIMAQQSCIEAIKGLFEKHQLLIAKRKNVMLQSLVLKEKALTLLNSYNNILNELTVTKQKIRQLQFLLTLTNLIHNGGTASSKDIYTSIDTLQKQDNLFINITDTISSKDKSTMFTSRPLKLSVTNVFKDKPAKLTSFVLPKDILSLIAQFAQSFNTILSKKVQAKDSTTASKVVLINKVLTRLTLLINNVKPSINHLLQQLITKTKQLLKQAQLVKQAMKSIKVSLVHSLEIKNNIVAELTNVKYSLNSQRVLANVIRRKIEQGLKQKRLLQFLFKLVKLPPTSQTQIVETIELFMKKVVDPKLTYPIDTFYNQTFGVTVLQNNNFKRMQQLERYFGGIANVLTSVGVTKQYLESTANMSSNDTCLNTSKIVAIIIGQQEEMNAVRECKKLGIKTIQIVDVNCNPRFADHIIPANDDSKTSIKYILTKLLTRIRMAQKLKTVVTLVQKAQY
uniref:ribosomal protein S2 n=1 Tax=Leontynka pallida TaxID=2912034 RepID=UPI002027C9B4|nr:ribosomal protein S2 [Leontynka pallida]UPQ43839.1 ribosomal protein S2 [Leontynka pallida]